jgi:pimeloyl-ACP methyl ester carboxylesterase
VAASGWLPADVVLSFGDLSRFSPAASPSTAPRFLILYGMPALALVVWAGFRLAPTVTGQRIGRRMFRSAPAEVTSPEQFDRFAGTYDTIVLGVVALLIGGHAAMLAAAFGAHAIAARLVPVVLGGSILLMGNVMPRLRPNWIAGIRTRRTLADPALWRSTHRAFGTAFVVAGLATIAVGLVAPRFGLIVALSGIVAALVVGFVASQRRRDGAALAAVALACTLGKGVGAQAPVPPVVELPTPATVVESAYSFTRDGLTIHGTLTMPPTVPGKVPVAVIVAGSGPTDRNANGPALNTNAYAMIAWGLAENGIATLRYDKRGIGQTGAPKGANPHQLSLDLFEADVYAAAEAMAADSRFSKVVLVGHSEGAGLSLQAANRGAPASAVVMVSPQGRKFTELVHEQYSRLTDSATVALIDSALARLLRGEDPGDIPPIARPFIVPAYRKYFQSFDAYDPPAEARKYGGPLLIVHGTTDLQTTMDDAGILVTAQPRATFARLDGVNHVLKHVASTQVQDQLKSYRDPHLPLAPSVIPTIARWINGGAPWK